MKKLFLSLVLSIGAISLFSFAKAQNNAVASVSGTENVEIVQENKMDYLKNEIMPQVALGISSIGTALLFYFPINSRMKKTSGLIRYETDKSTALYNELQVTSKKLDDREKEIKTLKEQVAETRKMVEETKKMVSLGFGNMNELVSKGVAKEISDVGGGADEK